MAAKKPTQPKKKPGRPSSYSPKIADALCAELANGTSLRTACLAEDMPSKATVFRWLRENAEFRDQYTRAKEESADALVEEMTDIADDGTNDWMEIDLPSGQTKVVLDHEHVQRSRLRIDTRKWVASKLKPKKYGDKIDVTTDGKELPTPILPLHVLRNNGDEENSSAE